MATSMQFGPEWMRKAANRSSSSLTKEPASPSPNAFPDAAGSPLVSQNNSSNALGSAASGARDGVGTGALGAGAGSAAAGNAVGNGNRRKPSLGTSTSSLASPTLGSGAGGASNGPTPVSPSVPSPGAFSFAAAAAGLSGGERDQRDRDRGSGTVTMSSSRMRLMKRGLTDGGPPSPGPGSPLATSSPSPLPPTPSSPSATPGTNTGGSNSSGLSRGAGGPWPGSRLRQRSLVDSAGPIGPAPDGSPGFNKFAGYDRKRERQQSTTTIPGTGSVRTASNGNGLGSSHGDPESRRSSIVASGGTAGSNDAAEHQAYQGEVANGDRVRNQDDLADSVAELNVGGKAGAEEAWSPEKAFWQYRDPTGQVQGPFSAVSMQDWYKQNYFTADLLVKRVEERDFRPLGEVLVELGDVATPFLLPPPKRTAPPGPAGLQSTSAGDGSMGASDQVDPGHRNGQNTLEGEAANVIGRHPQSSETGSIGGKALGPVDYQGEGVWPNARGEGNGGGILGHHAGHPGAMLGQPADSPVMNIGIGHRRPWPNLELDLGGFGAPAGASPASPFGPNGVPRSPYTAGGGLLGMGPQSARQPSGVPPSPFGVPSVAQLDLDARLRQQEEILALTRQRELQEQRQAAAAAAARAGYGGAIGAGLSIGALGGIPDAFGAMHTPASVPSPWQQYGGVSQPNSAAGGAAPFFEAFPHGGPRPIGHAVPGAPWSHAHVPQPRSSLEQGQDVFIQQQNANAQPASPWAQPTPSQDGPDVGTQQQAAGVSQDNQGRQPVADEQVPPSGTQTVPPVGTPGRARSPEPNAAPPVEAVQEPEPKPSEPPATDHQDAKPTKQGLEEEPSTGSTTEDVPTEDPEQLWPADPSAVEFAPEPAFNETPTSTGKSKYEDVTGAQGARRTRRGGRHPHTDNTGDDRDGEQSNDQSSGNVRVVSQDQFKRGAPGSSNAVEAPLSAWLPDAQGSTQSPTTAKPAPWASKVDDDNAGSSGPSLREIQAAEKRQAEAKKNAQRAAAERMAKASSATSPSASEPALPATMSWGLASVPPNGPKDAPLTPSMQAGGNAWQQKASTPAAAAPKKTLMEIQEEERKRAQRQAELKSAQAAAMRKGYADSASRSISNPAASVAAVAATPSGGAGGAWSVVGAGGKTAASTAGAASPSVNRTVSGSVPRLASGPPGAGWSTAASSAAGKAGAGGVKTAGTPSGLSTAASSGGVGGAARKPSGAAARPNVDSGAPASPSPEFLQYCKDHLKGLNIRVDDFIEMLLSFPLDPSPDVIEIIAESVYANSSTLDGRRFANDFVAKRKLDAQGRFGASAAPGGGHVAGFDAGVGVGGGDGAGLGGSGAGSSGGLGGSAGGAGAGAGAGGAWLPAGSSGRTASEVLKSQPAGGKDESPFGFKVVKAKGNKKRN